MPKFKLVEIRAPKDESSNEQVLVLQLAEKVASPLSSASLNTDYFYHKIEKDTCSIKLDAEVDIPANSFNVQVRKFFRTENGQSIEGTAKWLVFK